MSVLIQAEDFDVNTELAVLKGKSDEIGAVVAFTGLVRKDAGLLSLVLEHYPGMTEAEISRHVQEAHKRWPLLGVTVIHRTGTLAVGDNIVFVAVAAGHRQTAFAAAEFLMDYLKTHAPFWKLERREGTATWVAPRKADDEAVTRWDSE